MIRFVITILVTVSAFAHAADIYVDAPDDFSPPNPVADDVVTWKPGTPDAVTGLIFGTNAFTSIVDATSAAGGGDTVRIASGIYVESEVIEPFEAVTFVGDGPGKTILDGDSEFPLFYLDLSCTIKDLTIQNGYSDFSAGGISSFGMELTLSNIHFDGNFSEFDGGALDLLSPSQQEGQNLPQFVVIEGCLFTNNASPAGGVGGIYHEGDFFSQAGSNLTITNTTFSSNLNLAIRSTSGTLTLTHCTFFDNPSGAFDTFGDEGFPGSSVTLNNSLILDSFFASSTVVSNGTNFLATDTIGAGDLSYANTTADVPSDLIDTLLSDNGGTTATHQLTANSVAINAGTNADAVDAGNNPLPNDQRGPGFPRIAQGIVDIGAYEEAEPTLTLTIADPSISENGGSTSVTVSRNTDTNNALTVDLSSDDTSEATLPATLTIPIGQVSATVNLTAVDDTIVDGAQTINITASALGFIDGIDQLEITDNDVPTLTLSIADPSISENGGSTSVTVTRNTDTSGPLMLNLSSSDPSEATIPTNLTIPAGQASATATLSAVDDSFVDGTQTVTISAFASGFADGSADLEITDEDVATLTLSIENPSISENGGSTSITVSRNTAPNSDLDLTLSSSNPSEVTLPPTLTIPGEEVSATFILTAVDNAIVDGLRNVTISANANGFVNGSGGLEITDDDVPTLTLSIADESISEDGGSSVITVTRNTDPSSDLVLDLMADDPSEATLPATLTIPGGQVSATATLTAVEDGIVDGDQFVNITADATGFIGDTGGLEITDDDVPTLTLLIADPSISENGGSTSVTVTRNTAPNSDLILTLSNSDPSEAILPATLTIPAEEISTTVTLSAVDDDIVDGPQTVTISATATGFAGGSADLEITDDDVPSLILSIENQSISENGGSTVVTVSRNTDTTAALTVDLSSDDPSEATLPTTLTIPIGQVSATATLNAVDDGIVDGPQTVNITANATGFIGDTGGLEITDDDVPTLTLSIADESISENAGSSIVIVSRNTDTTTALTIDLSSDDPSEATLPATLTIPIGQLAATATLNAVDDGIVDGPQIVNITADANGFIGDTGQLEITDDDVPTLTLSFADPSISENGGSTSVTVTHNTGPRGEFIVNLSSDAPSEATLPATITIPGEEDSATVTLSAVDDAVVDGAQTVTISATANGFTGGSGGLEITDDDVPTLALSIADENISENGGSTSVTVSRNTDTTTALTIDLSSDDPSEATLPATLTIPIGQLAATATLNAVDDGIVDGPQTVNITANANGFIGDTGELEITDDDAPTLTLAIADLSISENGGSTSVSVTRNTDTTTALTVDLAGDDPSEATLPATLTIPIGQVSSTATLTAVDDGIVDGPQTVNITANANGFIDATGQLDITDDDLPLISLEGGGELSEPASFSSAPLSPSETDLILRRNGTLGDVAVTIAIDPGSQSEIGDDFTINGTSSPTISVTIPDGASETILRVQAIDDFAAEVDETIAVLLLPGSFDSGNTSVSLTIAQNDYGVTNLKDFDPAISPNGGEGALRQAMINAKANLTLPNTSPSEPQIVFRQDLVGEISLVAGALLLDQSSFSIIGPGSEQVSINGEASSRIFVANDPIQDLSFHISGLSMTGGFSDTSGGAIYNTESLFLSDCALGESTANIGGAIANEGKLELSNCVLWNNAATVYGGAIDSYSGMLSLNACTLSGNQAQFGGGIENGSGSELRVDSSTFSGNRAEASGGAIDSFDAIASISNTTISGNEAGFGAGIVNEQSVVSILQSTIAENVADSSVGGILTSANQPVSTTLHNTIVAGNSRADRPSELSTNNSSFVNVDPTSSNNLIGHAGTAGGLRNGINGNIVRNGAISTLRPLADNGGPTETHELTPDSPAIDAGDPAFAFDSDGMLLGTDQRGFPRIAFATIDIGAYEVAESPISIVSFELTPAVSAAISWTSEAGISYDVLRSTDLGTWQEIASEITAENELTSWTDNDLPPGKAFYIVRSSTVE